jgi:hypothetical protein
MGSNRRDVPGTPRLQSLVIFASGCGEEILAVSEERFWNSSSAEGRHYGRTKNSAAPASS